MTLYRRVSDLVCTTLFLGFSIGVYLNKNSNCVWDEEFFDSADTIPAYLIGSYFTVHLVTWLVIFVFFYRSIICIGYWYLISYFHLSRSTRQYITYAVEFCYGYWTAREILSAWCDLQRIRDCIRPTKVSDSSELVCQSIAILWMTRGIESLCERLTSSYDASNESYKADAWNPCLFIFQFFGHLLMTLLSCLFTFYLMCT